MVRFPRLDRHRAPSLTEELLSDSPAGARMARRRSALSRHPRWHGGPDDDFWLTKGDAVSRLVSNHLASILRQPDLVPLQVEPLCI